MVATKIKANNNNSKEMKNMQSILTMRGTKATDKLATKLESCNEKEDFFSVA